MWKNYIKIGFRSLLKQKLFALLNLVGLSLGICVGGLLLLYVFDEITFDKYHQNLDNIFRVIVNVDWDGEKHKWANAPNAVGPEATRNIAGVKDYSRLLHHNFGEIAFIQTDNKKLTEQSFYWADASIFSLFDIEFLQKKSENIMTAPNQVVVSESNAERYFGNESPLGKLIQVDNSIELEIVGVYKDFPSNSSLEAQMIGSFATMNWAKNLSWGNSRFETFLLFETGTTASEVEKSLAEILDKNVERSEQWYSLSLQPLDKMHLHSDDITNTYISRTGDSRQIRILLYLALIIIGIACINYMSLATSRSQQRLKEVGINKTIGASRSQLVIRFYFETGIMVLISVVISLLLLGISLPLFNQLADKSIEFNVLTKPIFLGGLLGIATLITLVSGAYPALFLSSFSPVSLFSKQTASKLGGKFFRKGLVVLQFTASIVIIIATIVFYNQLSFIQSKNLGYIPEKVIGIHTRGSESVAQVNRFMDQLTAVPSVQSVAYAQTFPGNGGSGYALNSPLKPGIDFPVQANRASPEIIDVLSLELLAGKTLPDREVTREDTIFQVVINETATEFLGYTPAEAIGKEAHGLFYNARAEIVGVVKDFHFDSFRQPIGGYVFHNRTSEWRQYALVKLRDDALPSMLKKTQTIFTETIPTSAFEFTFLDQKLESLYHRENKTANIFIIFSILSVFVACLGLFGLSAFTIERRTKEIGIRKILGASTSGITAILSQDFLKIVSMAIILSIPLSWYFMNRWLEDFAYQTKISVWVFVIAGSSALFITVLTVSVQGIRAALLNPIKSLRNE